MQLLVAPDIWELLVVWYICVKVCWNNGWFIHKRITNASQHTILLYSEIPRNYCHYKIFNKTNYSMWKQSIDKFTVEIAVYFIPINLFYHLSNCRTHMKLVWFFFFGIQTSSILCGIRNVLYETQNSKVWINKMCVNSVMLWDFLSGKNFIYLIFSCFPS